MAADGSIVIETDIDDKQAQKEINSLAKKIDTLQAKLDQKRGRQSALAEEALQIGIEFDNARAKLEQMQSGETFYTSDHIKQQQADVAALEKEWDKVRQAADKLQTEIYEGTQEVDRMKSRAGELQQQLAATAPSSQAMADAMARVQKSAEKFSTRLKRIVASALIFNVISSGLRQFTEWMGKAITSNDEASAAIARLKGALLTMVQPLVNVIIPAFTTFVNLLANIVSRVAQFVSALFGTTAEASAEAAESLYNEINAIEETGEAAEEAGKSLASFDEINKLSSEDSSSTSGSSSSSSGIEPDFDTGFISEGLNEIMAILGGALLAVGAVLVFSGANIPIGLELMAVGALILGSAIAANWGAIVAMLQGPLGVIMALLGGALLVLGAILTFSGTNILLGLGLMAAGAIALGSAAAANWETIVSLLQGPIGVIVGILSGALLVIGAVILFSGVNMPLGLGLFIAGAIGLATTVAANWEAVQTALQGPIGAITALLGTAFLVLGAVLTFTGANIPLGIGLLVLGAAGLATSLSANWETIQNALQGPIGTLTAIVSTALLVLGALLTFSGAATPLGIGLLVLGAVGLATTIAANWDYLTGLLGGTIGTITTIVSAALLVLGAILIFTGAAAPLGLGLLIAGGAGLAVAVAPNWSFIQDAISAAWDSFTAWWEAGPSKFFTLDYWLGLGQDMLDGLFNGLSAIGSKITSWGSSLIDGVCNFFGINSPSTEFESLGDYMMMGMANGITGTQALVLTAFQTVLTALQTEFTEWHTNFMAGFSEFASAFTESWTALWNNVNVLFVLSWNNILTTFQNGINNAVTALNRLVDAANSLSDLTGKSYGYVSSISVSMLDIPKLAQGAVIPPNREFLAVLGDQKSGTNIEAPLSTIEQAVENVLSRMGYGAEQTVILQVDKDQLGKVVYKLNKAETRRIGVNLAGV